LKALTDLIAPSPFTECLSDDEVATARNGISNRQMQNVGESCVAVTSSIIATAEEKMARSANDDILTLVRNSMAPKGTLFVRVIDNDDITSVTYLGEGDYLSPPVYVSNASEERPYNDGLSGVQTALIALGAGLFFIAVIFVVLGRRKKRIEADEIPLQNQWEPKSDDFSGVTV